MDKSDATVIDDFLASYSAALAATGRLLIHAKISPKLVDLQGGRATRRATANYGYNTRGFFDSFAVLQSRMSASNLIWSRRSHIKVVYSSVSSARQQPRSPIVNVLAQKY